jgi:hypothetical protein
MSSIFLAKQEQRKQDLMALMKVALKAPDYEPIDQREERVVNMLEVETRVPIWVVCKAFAVCNGNQYLTRDILEYYHDVKSLSV